MPINALTGLMGSGKSFECVVSVILPALRAGRNVLTNVDGIDNDACRAYCVEKFNSSMETLGNVIHCTNEQVSSPLFLPHGTDAETVVKAGDLVCIDEAWRFWGTDKKLLPEHAIFFREHRHYVNPETKVSCDLVLMVQDIGDLHRTLKVVVELSFRTTKLKSLGFSKTYRVEMWQGYKQTVKARTSVEVKKYDKAIFPLYSSYVGGHGKELQVDKRQNIFNNKMLWFYIVFLLGMGFVAVYFVVRFFSVPTTAKKDSKSVTGVTVPLFDPYTGKALPKPQQATDGRFTGATPLGSPPLFSETWRIVGRFQSNDTQYVVVSNTMGRIRLEHPSNFQNNGSTTIGKIDGETVTFWSGNTMTDVNQGKK
jgi:zona occludens toxin